MSTVVAVARNAGVATVGAVAAARRGGPGALVFRLLAWVAGTLALTLAIAPPGVPAVIPLAIAAAVALPPALVPGHWVVLVLELLAIAGWLLRTSLFAEPVPSYAVVAVLAVALYVHHSACAYAACLPYDTRLAGAADRLPDTSESAPRPVLRAWLLRVVAVTAGTGALAVLGALLAGQLTPSRSAVVPVLGVLLALLVAAGLAHLATRRGQD